MRDYLNKTLIVFFILSLTLSSCNSRDERIKSKENQPLVVNSQEIKIAKAVFYLENSESMFGYVNGFTEYVDVISELAEKPDFAAEKTKREFNFINGGTPLSINCLGNDPKIFKSKLNTSGFRCGDITKSNLNGMFQIALDRAQNDTISILISDAIYDIGQPQSPLNALITEGRETRSKFISRLENGNIQCLMIKLFSSFEGNYFYSSHSGKTYINQSRPFYIWVFGKSELLNKYFSETYISQHLKGFVYYARFIPIEENKVPYQINPAINRKGSFKPDRKNQNKLINAETRHGEFQFAFAVDYSSIPFSSNYFSNIDNYSLSNQNFKIVSINEIKKDEKYGITLFTNPTHLITIQTDKNPCGDLEITLKNEIPSWILESDADNEHIIDSKKTFGLKYLTNGISEAYQHTNRSKNLAMFKISISN